MALNFQSCNFFHSFIYKSICKKQVKLRLIKMFSPDFFILLIKQENRKSLTAFLSAFLLKNALQDSQVIALKLYPRALSPQTVHTLSSLDLFLLHRPLSFPPSVIPSLHDIVELSLSQTDSSRPSSDWKSGNIKHCEPKNDIIYPSFNIIHSTLCFFILHCLFLYYTLSFSILHSLVLYYTLSCSILHCLVLYYTLSCSILHCLVLYYTLSFSILHCLVLYYTLSFSILHCLVLYYTVLFYITLSCSILHSFSRNSCWWLYVLSSPILI